MKIKFIIVLVLLSLITAGYASDDEVKPRKTKNPNITLYYADLLGAGSNMLVEVEYKSLPEPVTEVRAKINKKSEIIDSFSIPGKIRNILFKEFNFDRKQRIIITFDGKNNISNIVIYQFNDGKLTKIFFASSAFGIETDFRAASRVKIGKSLQPEDSPNCIPDWDTWIWIGDKFIKEN